MCVTLRTRRETFHTGRRKHTHGVDSESRWALSLHFSPNSLSSRTDLCSEDDGKDGSDEENDEDEHQRRAELKNRNTNQKTRSRTRVHVHRHIPVHTHVTRIGSTWMRQISVLNGFTQCFTHAYTEDALTT